MEDRCFSFYTVALRCSVFDTFSIVLSTYTHIYLRSGCCFDNNSYSSAKCLSYVAVVISMFVSFSDMRFELFESTLCGQVVDYKLSQEPRLCNLVCT